MSLPPYKRRNSWRNSALVIEYDGLYLLCEQQQERLKKGAKGKSALQDEVEVLREKLKKQLDTCEDAKEELRESVRELKVTVGNLRDEMRVVRQQPSNEGYNGVLDKKEASENEKTDLLDQKQILEIRLKSLHDTSEELEAQLESLRSKNCNNCGSSDIDSSSDEQLEYEMDYAPVQTTVPNYWNHTAFPPGTSMTRSEDKLRTRLEETEKTYDKVRAKLRRCGG
jgi:chaperonin cofactor prefoldin